MDMFLFLKQKHHFITLNILYMIMSLFLSGGEEKEKNFFIFFLLLKTTNTYTFLTFCEIP
jgi:hypothetical protein